MFKNHLKIAWRNLRKDGLFSTIKIGGFAIGIAACLLIALFIKDELSYDTNYVHQDEIYRVIVEAPVQGEMRKMIHFQLPFADQIKADIPEITVAGKYNAGELFGAGKKSIRLSGEVQNNSDDGFVFANQDILEVLEFDFVEGKKEGALTQPYSLVISQEKALKYFPNGNAVGQSVVLDSDEQNPYTITGVMAKREGNSHFTYDFLMDIQDTQNNWVNNNYLTLIRLQKGSNPDLVAEKMHSIIINFMLAAYKDAGYTEYEEALGKSHFILQPVADIHLKTDPKMFDHLSHGDIRFVWLFAAIALFVLLLAVINFINLSTAKSANRAKEVGLRKTVGAFKNHLVSQFLIESFVFSFLSFVLGLLLTWILLPFFNEMAAKSLFIPITSIGFILLLIASISIIGLIAGLYPAFYLSKFRPIDVLKGSLAIGSKSGRLRSGLVVFQFTTSVVLIIGTIIIYQQMNYILDKDIGYDKEQVLVIQGATSLGNKSASFKQQLTSIPTVKSATMSGYMPVDGGRRNGNTFKKVGEGSQDKGIPSQIWRVDVDYAKTLGIKIKEGRDFSKDFASDSMGILINETMVKQLNLTDPIGKTISNGLDWKIVGVFKDFNFRTLKDKVSPLALVIGESPNLMALKLNTTDLSGSIAAIADLWNTNVPSQAFEYTFLDQDFERMHREVKRMGSIFNSFALFAILVACLGLFALSAFMAEQRRKEISIRLVLGASFKSIYKLLSLNFIKLIGISILIAIPIAWYIMGRWLEDFAYRIELSWTIFLWAAVIALGVALLTVSYQSIKSALLKPLQSLRSE